MAGNVLAVCTGNICRSPFVERVLASWVPYSDITIASAGIHAVVGSPIEPHAAATIELWGASVAGFAARQVTAEMTAQADLIIALSRRHRAALVRLDPSALGKVFTLRELGRLIPDAAPHVSGASAAQRLEAAVPVLAHMRGMAPIQDPTADDVPDPFGGTDADYTRAARTMVGPLDRVAALLCGRA